MVFALFAKVDSLGSQTQMHAWPHVRKPTMKRMHHAPAFNARQAVPPAQTADSQIASHAKPITIRLLQMSVPNAMICALTVTDPIPQTVQRVPVEHIKSMELPQLVFQIVEHKSMLQMRSATVTIIQFRMRLPL